MSDIEPSIIEPVLDATEVRRILSVSEATLYRWLREARQGVGTLPFPVNTGGRKRRLLWTRASILAFLEDRDRRPPQSSLGFMSEAERAKRLGDAMKDLKDMGVKVQSEK